MEYHIFSNPTPEPRGGKSSIGGIFKKFIPIFALAAILPVLLFAAGNTVDYDFTSSANQDPILRVWLEPAAVVLSPGESIALEVVADLESESDQVHTITAQIPPITGLRITPTQVSHTPPFRGQTTLGEITVTAMTNGKYTVNVPSATIKTSIDDLEIVTSPAIIEVN